MQSFSIVLILGCSLFISETFCNPLSTSSEYNGLEGQIVKENSSVLEYAEPFDTYDNENEGVSYEYSEEITNTSAILSPTILDTENTIDHDVPQNESQEAKDLIPFPTTQYNGYPLPPFPVLASTIDPQLEDSLSTEETYDGIDGGNWDKEAYSASEEDKTFVNVEPTDNTLSVPFESSSTTPVLLEEPTAVVVDSSLDEEREISEYVGVNSEEQQRNLTIILPKQEELDHIDFTSKDSEHLDQAEDTSEYFASSEEGDLSDEDIVHNSHHHIHGKELSTTPEAIEEPLSTSRPIIVDEESTELEPTTTFRASLSSRMQVGNIALLTSLLISLKFL